MGASPSALTLSDSFKVTYLLQENVPLANKVLTYFINLDDRPDRRSEIESELRRCNILGTRVPAIKYTPGIVGCAFSHIKALEKGIADEADHILIFEDDFYFTVDPDLATKLVQTVIQTNYDVFMLGYGIFEGSDKSLFFTSHPLFKKIINATCAHGYLVNKHYAHKLLQNLKEGVDLRLKTKKQRHNNDEHWKLLQEDDLWLCYSHGPLGMQREGFSDIDNSMKWNDTTFVNLSLGLKQN